jgi:hypothetical protein
MTLGARRRGGAGAAWKPRRRSYAARETGSARMQLGVRRPRLDPEHRVMIVGVAHSSRLRRFRACISFHSCFCSSVQTTPFQGS